MCYKNDQIVAQAAWEFASLFDEKLLGAIVALAHSLGQHLRLNDFVICYFHKVYFNASTTMHTWAQTHPHTVHVDMWSAWKLFRWEVRTWLSKGKKLKMATETMLKHSPEVISAVVFRVPFLLLREWGGFVRVWQRKHCRCRNHFG